jgi:probable phosphoglycerate mutase
MTTGEIWLIRHGETVWSREGKHTGRTDVPLTEEGERQARALGASLAGHRFAAVWTSPLQRARETCRLAGYGDQAQATDLLMEWDYGAYEGRTSAEIGAEIPGWTIWEQGVRQGESLEQVAGRAAAILALAEPVVAGGGDVAFFGHGHILRAIAASWLEQPPRAGRLFALGTAARSILGYEHGGRVLQLWNRPP